MQKAEALIKEIELLKKQIKELEDRVNLQEEYCFESIADAMSMVETALQFSDLDNIPEFAHENVIILHTNCFRTAALAYAYDSEYDERYYMHALPDKMLTPEELSNNINCSQENAYIILKSNIFSISDEFEKIVLDAIADKKVTFVICTSNLEHIPQSIREKMRVIQ